MTNRADVLDTIDQFIVDTLSNPEIKKSPEMVAAIAELFQATKMG